MERLNIKVVISAIALIILAVVNSLYQQDVMRILRAILESKALIYGLLAYVSITIFIHSVFVKESYLLDIPVFKTQVGLPLDIALTIGTYAAVSTTSIALIKGAYIQQFYGDVIYFNEFDSIDIYSLLGVAALLLWYVIFHTTRMLKEALFYTVSAEEVESA